VQYLKKVLGKALGEPRAQGIVDGMVKAGTGRALERLKWHDPGTIAAFISEEHPQVIAVILANLGDTRLAQAVLAALPDALQQDLQPRLAKLRTIPTAWLDEIERSLGEVAPSDSDTEGESGPERVASLLASASSATEKRWLGDIERRSPALAERVRDHLFPFGDLIKVDSYGMQKVLARTPGDDIVLALRVADEDLKRHFLTNLSPQAAASIEQALEELGPTSIALIEAAQRRIATTANEMEQRGELFVLERKKPKPTEKGR
jgi:flagellar motor switch protein FliG